MLLRGDGRHRVVGLAGIDRPGPPARLGTARQVCVMVLVVTAAASALAASQPTGTRALYTRGAAAQTNTIDGGDWGIPTQCGTGYDGIIYGTPGDDVLVGGNKSQIILGRGGNDIIYAGNSGDCLVGGNGDDKLYGSNAKDILLGGPGDDYLSGDNGRDRLDGGTGTDRCGGGNATDVLANCESTS